VVEGGGLETQFRPFSQVEQNQLNPLASQQLAPTSELHLTPLVFIHF